MSMTNHIEIIEQGHYNMKTMDYQHYQEYLSDSIIELGHYEDLGIAIEQATLFEENHAKLGITGKFKTEVIRMVCETGRGDIFDDGYIFLMIPGIFVLPRTSMVFFDCFLLS